MRLLRNGKFFAICFALLMGLFVVALVIPNQKEEHPFQ